MAYVFLRDLPDGIRHLLFWDERRSAWFASVHLDAPWTTFGHPVPEHEKASGDLVPVGPVDPHAWFGRLGTPSEVVRALLDGTTVEKYRHWTEPLLAVMVLAPEDPGRASALLETLHDLDAPVAERAERVASRFGWPPPGLEMMSLPSHAEVLATVTRTISADLTLAEAHHRARRWLRRSPAEPIRTLLQSLAELASPRPSEVASWQRDLESLRSRYLARAGSSWPDELPEVGTVAGWPVRYVKRPRLVDRSFESHGGNCPHGLPGDGRGRVDVFFDYCAFPVWGSGGGCMAGAAGLGLGPELTADLWSWSRSHDRRAVPGENSRRGDLVAQSEDSRLQVLADRLEEQTGLAAPVRRHRGYGDGSCPTRHCLGASATDAD